MKGGLKTQAQALSIAAHLMQGGTTVFICSTSEQGDHVWWLVEGVLTPYMSRKQLLRCKARYSFEVTKAQKKGGSI